MSDLSREDTMKMQAVAGSDNDNSSLQFIIDGKNINVLYYVIDLITIALTIIAFNNDWTNRTNNRINDITGVVKIRD